MSEKKTTDKRGRFGRDASEEFSRPMVQGKKKKKL